jgi:CD2 antigen cytoplasmic tail-binding protein 2
MSGRRPAPRPKRGGEEFARTHHQNVESSSSKKPRFDIRNPSALVPDAPEEDAILEADEIGKRGQQTKRNAVNIDGFESDSSNEGFDARAAAKAKQAKKGNGAVASAMEEEHDMFADLEESKFGDGDDDEELYGEGKKKKKDVRFVDVDEIEGQVDDSIGGGHVKADYVSRSSILGSNGMRSIRNGNGKEEEEESESSTDSEVADEVRAEVGSDIDEEVGAGGKKKHAPKLDAFNLKSEKEDGGFDEQLNYVRKAADPDAKHDTWLEGVSKKDMKKAREAEDKRDQERRRKIREADAVLTSELLRTLITCLERGETVLEALARLGRSKEKKQPRWQNKNKNKRKGSNEMDVDVSKPADSPAETRRRQAVEAITEAADQLLTRGQNEIYDAERELLMRQYQRETGEEWVDPPQEAAENIEDEVEQKQWEYRWSDKRDGGEAHGPYDSNMMVQWNDAGYFGDGVEFRSIGDGGSWTRATNFH